MARTFQGAGDVLRVLELQELRNEAEAFARRHPELESPFIDFSLPYPQRVIHESQLAHIARYGTGCSDPDCWFCRCVRVRADLDVMGAEVAALPWDWPPRPTDLVRLLQSDPAIDGKALGEHLARALGVQP